jgi:hypothetical protein
VVDPVSLGAITTGLIVKAVDRAEDDALDAGTGALRRLLGFVRDLCNPSFRLRTWESVRAFPQSDGHHEHERRLGYDAFTLHALGPDQPPRTPLMRVRAAGPDELQKCPQSDPRAESGRL